MPRDLVQDSLTALNEGVPTAPPRLSRRRRSAVLALDMDGDIACTLIARRRVGYVASETYLFELQNGEWTYLGGGGGPGDDLFRPRPAPTPEGEHLHPMGSAAIRRAPGRRGAWIRDIELRCSPQVASLSVNGRSLAVAEHGNVVVVWDSPNAPTLTAMDADGRALQTFRPAST
ncbi:hypothetical protein [Kineococcus sp. SYSU DK002]|uniref:hypothetical protein n=1 Tax=Kineococcus sp. SYSU DK002 TaxID=3383123 RepID=UPI003D7EBF4E